MRQRAPGRVLQTLSHRLHGQHRAAAHRRRRQAEAASTFGFIGPQQYNPWNSDDVLYVGTTFTQHGDYRQGVPAISSRNLDNLQFAEFSFSRQSLLRIDVKYRDHFLVDYVHG